MKSIDEMAVDTIRFLAVDAVEKANSGHPGLPMGGATMAYTLWARFLKHCPKRPDWPDRDRFVLSAGHGSMLLYALLHLFGYSLSLDEIKNFRQWGSRTPGHPEFGHTPGVETTTGPLGQGFANAVGMAVAERRLAAEFNRQGFTLVDHYTYIYAGDGCMMEGVTSEAASLAGHLKLGKLICLYDDNQITIDGSTSLAFTEDVGKRFEAYGWQVLKVENGNCFEAVEEAIKEARVELTRPSLLMIRTEIGYGAPNKQGTAEAHGAPLGAEEVILAKENLGWPTEPTFYIPPEVRAHFEGYAEALNEKKEAWENLFTAYRAEHPELSEQWDRWFSGRVPEEIPEDPRLCQFGEKPLATRVISGQIMQVLAEYLPNMISGSADLNASTRTHLKGFGDFQADNPRGNNIHFGVREHAMAAILSGIMLHGGLRAFGSTFLVFFDYMKPAVRLAAMMGLPVVYIFTHDSIALGEDGPTHQPVEHLANLRSIPNIHVLRPGDGAETAAAWLHILQRRCGPSALILSRQNLPQLPGTGRGVLQGGYIISRENREKPDLILIASGSELFLALQAQNILQDEKGFSVRVVSMVSRELFLAQDDAYREEVIPDTVERRLIIEAAMPMGWERFTGLKGAVIGLDDFGASAPGEIVMAKRGITVAHILKQAAEMLK
ncbi:MAG TPA: transketolase [Candidatus Limnocylindrales bacterium]|nr:transketolase [Candidatus Limnocylindrales bacterium]